MTVVVARESLVAPGHRAIPKGTLVDDTDEVVKANPAMFDTVEAAAAASPDVHEGRKPPQDQEPQVPEPPKKRTLRK